MEKVASPDVLIVGLGYFAVGELSIAYWDCLLMTLEASP